eukprot:TRINITY_DN21414_c0_g1_i1.p1 TRINITY_DN21414_c0_g1~~TRINITY_DN21414_c0_g1_i1.p1  ORF type:complete len:977 (+),score=205.91 TRINITY_DN21414_c0_g1_i1:559-3489(+)
MEIESQNNRIALLEKNGIISSATSPAPSALDLAHTEVDRYKLLVDELSGNVTELENQLVAMRSSHSANDAVRQLAEKVKSLEDELRLRPTTQRYRASLIATTNLSEKCKKLEAALAANPRLNNDPLPVVLSPSTASNVSEKLRAVEAKCQNYEQKQSDAATIHEKQLLQLQNEVLALKEAASQTSIVHAEASRSMKEEYDFRLEQSEQETARLAHERDGLVSRLSQLEASLSQQQPRVVKEEADPPGPSREMAQLQADKASLEDELMKMAASLERSSETTKEVHEIETRLRLKEGDLKAANIEIDALKRERSLREGSRLDSLNNDTYDAMEARLNQAERALGKTTEEKFILEKELQETNEKLDDAIHQLNNNFKAEAMALDISCTMDNSPAESTASVVGAENERLIQENTLMQTRIVSSQTSLSELRKELSDLQTKLHMKESQLKASEIELASLQRERDLLSTSRAVLVQNSDKHVDTELKCRELEENCSELQKQLDGVSEKNKLLTEQLKNNFRSESESQQIIEDLEGRLNAIELSRTIKDDNKVKELESIEADLTKQVSELERKLQDSKTAGETYASLEQKLVDANHDISRLTTLNEELQRNNTEHTSQIGKLTTERDSLMSKHARKCEAAEQKQHNVEDKINTLQHEAVSAKNRASELRKDLEKLQAKHNETIGEKQSLEQEIEKLQHQARTVSDAVHIEHKLEDSKQHAAMLSEQLSDANAKIQRFSEKIDDLETENGRLLSCEARLRKMEYETSKPTKQRASSIKIDHSDALSRQSSMRTDLRSSISSLPSMRKVESSTSVSSLRRDLIPKGGTETPGAASVVQSEQHTVRHMGTPSIDENGRLEEIDEHDTSISHEQATISTLKKREDELTEAVEFCYDLLEDLQALHKEAHGKDAPDAAYLMEMIDTLMPDEREDSDDSLSKRDIKAFFDSAGIKLNSLADIAQDLVARVGVLKGGETTDEEEEEEEEE